MVERDDEIALVVSDVEMPRVDGLALTRAMCGCARMISSARASSVLRSR